MKVKEIVEKVEDIASGITNKAGLELVEAEFVKEGGTKYLRVYIDKPGGITIDDCEAVSRDLEAVLDRDDFIEEAYTLEVSSPGLDRILKKDFEYEKYKGRTVEIKLYKPKDGTKEFEGELIGLVDGKIIIKTEDGELSFDRSETAVCRLAVIL
ncbi:MAG: ribosome maturation factor RimP [Eubacterium sp.]|nr:ribosome maturation factor RimP [Eubacterium sp.]